MTGNLTTPKYTKTYASFTIAVSVFVEKSAQLRPKTCDSLEKGGSCPRKSAKMVAAILEATGSGGSEVRLISVLDTGILQSPVFR